MSKKVRFSARPPTSTQAATTVAVPNQSAIDTWVGGQTIPADDEKPQLNDVKKEISGPVKRFTFEVPVALHRRIKMKCAAEGRQMADVVRELLDKHFPEG